MSLLLKKPVRSSGVAVDVAREGVRIPLSEARVREIVQQVCKGEKVREAMISVTFLSNRAIAKLNREYLQHAGATDVITFALNSEDRLSGRAVPNALVGDIYIAPEVAKANALANGVGVREELIRLVIHGTLHVLGHTHAEDDTRVNGPMWQKQERYVGRLA